MRRALPIAATVAMVTALLAAPPALATHDRTLRGPVEGGGKAVVKITYLRKHGVRYRKYATHFHGIRMKCDGGATVSSGVPGGGSTIRNNASGRREFGLGASGIGSDGTESGWRFGGKLSRPREATGFVKIFNDREPIGGGRTDHCSSGRLSWTAAG